MNIIKVSFLIIGTIIGAGFASGKEIYEYFVVYGNNCLFTLPILFISFFICIFLLLKIGQKTKIKYIDELNGKLFNNKRIINIFTFFTFLILNSAMFSGFLNIIKIYFPNFNTIFAIFICILFTILLSNINLKLFTYLSFIIVPFMIILMIINDCKILQLTSNISKSMLSIISILMPVLYVFQNVFLSSFVIVKSAKDLSNRQCVLTAILTSSVICFLIGLSCIALLKSDYGMSEIPFAESALSINSTFGYIYGLVLVCAIITTCISTLTTFKEFFNGKKFYENQFVMISLIVILGLFDFSFIVAYLYPIIGCIGFVYIVFCYRYLHNEKYKRRYQVSPKLKNINV